MTCHRIANGVVCCYEPAFKFRFRRKWIVVFIDYFGPYFEDTRGHPYYPPERRTTEFWKRYQECIEKRREASK